MRQDLFDRFLWENLTMNFTKSMENNVEFLTLAIQSSLSYSSLCLTSYKLLTTNMKESSPSLIVFKFEDLAMILLLN